ncbi:hypothetical protein, partial [Xanthomonas sacchari]|uniref:hypothetical protein n=2 Tax=Xanthomonas sacchari TaxID=56458 RepID=UPI00225BCC12
MRGQEWVKRAHDDGLAGRTTIPGLGLPAASVAELLAEHPGTGDGGRCEFAGASGVDGPSAHDGHDEAAHYTWRGPLAQCAGRFTRRAA